MQRPIIALALFLNIAACDAGGAGTTWPTQPQQASQPRCTSSPCGNTASGKDPLEERIEAGTAIVDAARAGDDDRKRWSNPIYSTSDKPDRLALDVIRSAGLRLRLIPAQGRLVISTPTSTHVFAIAGAQGSGDVCPAYNLYVRDASSEHILVERMCRTFEYKPDRYARSVTYYLYDQPTGTMVDIWTASASGKDDPMPEADPRPVVKRITGGYQFDWAGTQAGNAGKRRHEMHNRYLRKFSGAQKSLLCKNVSTGPGRGDDSTCEGGYLERIGG
jgi:hypothetical protein